MAKPASVDARRGKSAQPGSLFLNNAYPSAADRRTRIEAIPGMLVGYRDRIREALSEDFAVHPELLTDLVEVLGVAGRAMYAAEQLERWMQDEERAGDPAVFGTAAPQCAASQRV